MSAILAGFLVRTLAGGGDDPAVPDLAAARAQRIERVVADLEARLAAPRAADGASRYAHALEQALAQAGGEPFWRGGHGSIPVSTLEGWLRWNSPQRGRELPAAQDVGLDGHPHAAVADLARQLGARDVEFLFVTFPNRVQCYPEIVLPPPEGSAGDSDRAAELAAMHLAIQEAHTRFLLGLARAGVEVVDLAAPFFERRFDGDDPRRRFLYHRDNAHWTPRGAALAAQVVAGRVAAMPWFREGPYREGRSFDVVARDMKFDNAGSGQAPGSEIEMIHAEMVRMRGRDLKREDRRDGPIVLLGDSFTEFHQKWNASFADQLLRFTGWPVDVVAPLGGGELSCRDALRRRGDGLAGKKLVIWLLQESVLQPSKQFAPLPVFPE